MVVHGVKGYVPNVDPSVFDTAFVIENGKIVMETNIDMNGHNILNVPNPQNSSDVTTLSL